MEVYHRGGSNAASRILLITGRARSFFSLAVALAASKRSGKLHRSSASRRPAATFEYAISRRLCIGMLLEWPKVCQFRHMGSASRASRRGHLSDVRGSQLGAHRCEPGQCHRVRGHVEHVFRHWRSRGFHRVPIGFSVGSVHGLGRLPICGIEVLLKAIDYSGKNYLLQHRTGGLDKGETAAPHVSLHGRVRSSTLIPPPPRLKNTAWAKQNDRGTSKSRTKRTVIPS